MSAWSADHLDLVEPAYMNSMDRAAERSHFERFRRRWNDAADFDWHGFDEGDEVNGDGFVELQPDGSLEGEFAFFNSLLGETRLSHPRGRPNLESPLRAITDRVTVGTTPLGAPCGSIRGVAVCSEPIEAFAAAASRCHCPTICHDFFQSDRRCARRND
jgi:hypothetical protein